MSRPPASHYSRLVHRQLRPQHNRTQTQDGTVATTISHRCSSKHTPVRHGSSVPGPLEGRNRMGRRRMGGLHSEIQPPAPLWEFENSLDLSQWQWKPPKSPEALRAARERPIDDAQSASFTQLSRWLFGSDSSSEQPFLQVDQLNTAEAVAPELQVVPEPPVIENVQSWVATGPPTPSSSPKALVQEGLDILEADIVNADILTDAVSPSYTNLDRFCASLEQSLLDENFSDGDIFAICRDLVVGVWPLYEKAWVLHQCRSVQMRKFSLPIAGPEAAAKETCAYRGRKPTQKLLDKKTFLDATEKATMQLLSTIIRGVSTRVSRAQKPCDYQIWSLLIHHVSSWERNSVRLFCRIMTNIPDHHIGKLKVSRLLIKYLENSIVTMGNNSVPHSTLVRQINDLAGALANFDPQRLGKILDGVTQKLLNIDTQKSWATQHNAHRKEPAKHGISEAQLLQHDLREAETIEHVLREAQLRKHRIIEDQHLRNDILKAERMCGDIREAQKSLLSRNFTTMRFAWLQLLARLPGVSDDYFTSTCASLGTGPGRPSVSQLEVCQLFVAHMRSQDRLDKPEFVYESLKEWKEKNESRPINPGAIYCKTKQPWLVGDLYRFMNAVGRSQDAVSMVKQLKPLVQFDIRPLISLAIEMRQWDLALDIVAKHGSSRATGTGKEDFWQSSLATRALTVLVNHPLVQHDKIFEALRIRIRPRRRMFQYPRPWSKAPFYLKHQMRKVQRLAEAISNSPNIPERRALDLIRKCVQYTRSKDARVPGGLLTVLYQQITKDLQQGRPGRTSRLRWFLHLMYKQRGYDKMIETGLILKDLRNKIFLGRKH